MSTTICQSLLYMLRISEQVHGQDKQAHCSWGSYILVSGGGGEIGNKQVNKYTVRRSWGSNECHGDI